MCAIVGVLGPLPKKEIFVEARDTMEHRGPDDEGLYYNEEEDMAFGHRRLSIIDLSEKGRQPFKDRSGRFLIVFNGEIYNYLEIKKELENFYDFKTESDTEVLLAAFIKWKEKCLAKLNGMFAFAVWDREEKKLFLARDRFGKKPLYYAINGNSFYFASEVKAIFTASKMKKKLFHRALFDYLNYRYVLGENTFYEGIFSLLPGYYMEVSIKNKEPLLRKKTYWELPIIERKKDLGEREIVQKTKELLTDAIRLRMRSDVPYGAYLSGGLDSSVIVAIMSELSSKPVHTFSAGFPEDEFNELPHARNISKAFSTNHHEIILKKEEYFKELPRIIKVKDSPLLSPNEVPWALLSRELKSNSTVVLSGNGADELFGGYGRIFQSAYDFDRMQISHGNQKAKGKKEDELLVHLKEKYGKNLYTKRVDHFLSQYKYFPLFLTKEIISEKFRKNILDLSNKKYFNTLFRDLEGLSTQDAYLYIFQKTHLLGTLLHFDNVTMIASVEGRAPYVDYRLVEYVSALPSSYKIAWRSKKDFKKGAILNSDQISETHDIPKYLLKKIGENVLPKGILSRKKLGFPVPLNSWISQKTSTFVSDLLLSRDSKTSGIFDKKAVKSLVVDGKKASNPKNGLYVWMLLNIELWLRECNVDV